MSSPIFRDIPPRAAAVIVALVLVASVVSGSQWGPGANPAPEPRTPPQETTEAPALELERLERRKASGRVPDLFATPIPAAAKVRTAAAKSAQPAPVVAVAPPLPPIPYRYLGRMEDGERRIVFLEKGPVVLTAAAGDTIEGIYRIESVSETAIAFRHIARDTVQTLQVPAQR